MAPEGQKLDGYWPALKGTSFATGIDAGFYNSASNQVVLFKAGKITLFDPDSSTQAAENPINSVFANWPKSASSPDAAILLPDATTALVFIGMDCMQLDLTKGLALTDSAKSIDEAVSNWPSETVFGSGVDGGFSVPDEKIAFLFNETIYVKLDLATRKVIDGYPRYIAAGWPGWPDEVTLPAWADYQDMLDMDRQNLVAKALDEGLLDSWITAAAKQTPDYAVDLKHQKSRIENIPLSNAALGALQGMNTDQPELEPQTTIKKPDPPTSA